MRVVLDTNILVSALMIQTGNPAAIYRAWREGHFVLLTCAEHLTELGATLRKPAIAEREPDGLVEHEIDELRRRPRQPVPGRARALQAESNHQGVAR